MGEASKAIESTGDEFIIQVSQEYKRESELARTERMRLNEINRGAFEGRQDFSYKQAGQSQEFIPKVTSSTQQFAAFIKRGLTQFGDWFSMEFPDETFMTADNAREILKSYLDNMPFRHNESTSAPLVLSDGAKVALNEALIVIKVHGELREKTRFYGKKYKCWRLRWDLIPTEDYYPDPTGRGLYEMHRVEKDFFEVKRQAKQGLYDESVLNQITADETRKEQEAMQRKADRRETSTTNPSVRKRIVIDEYHGNILDKDGTILHENVVWAVANDRYLIRKPKKNQFWHGQSPFVVAPLLRVPFSVWHRALNDQSSPLNFAMNELFNLMLDGGLAAVWGIKQLHQSWLEDERQVAEGIPQGMTLAVNDQCPPDGKVLDQVSTGNVPPEALAMYNLVSKEFDSASLTNDIKMGLLPSKQVKATEVVESSQSHSVMLDDVISDLEQYISQLLRKSWLCIMQNADDLEVGEIDTAAGRRTALQLARMSDKERYALIGEPAGFRVFGLSATMSRARDFQRMMAAMQAFASNPLLLQAFHKRYSEDKIVTQIIKQLNINPEAIARDEKELQQMGQDAGRAALMQQMGLTANGGGGMTGEPGMQSEVQQEMQPSAGI